MLTIHYLFVISNNILARGLEFRCIFSGGGSGIQMRPAMGSISMGEGSGIQMKRSWGRNFVINFGFHGGGVRASKGATIHCPKIMKVQQGNALNPTTPGI